MKLHSAKVWVCLAVFEAHEERDGRVCERGFWGGPDGGSVRIACRGTYTAGSDFSSPAWCASLMRSQARPPLPGSVWTREFV